MEILPASDNTIATYGEPLLFKQQKKPDDTAHEIIRPSKPVPLVIGMSGKESLTANMVEQVRQAHERRAVAYDMVFDQARLHHY